MSRPCLVRCHDPKRNTDKVSTDTEVDNFTRFEFSPALFSTPTPTPTLKPGTKLFTVPVASLVLVLVLVAVMVTVFGTAATPGPATTPIRGPPHTVLTAKQQRKKEKWRFWGARVHVNTYPYGNTLFRRPPFAVCLRHGGWVGLGWVGFSSVVQYWNATCVTWHVNQGF